MEEVEATERRTAIGHGRSTIHTVEHVLAAVMAAGTDDLLIELDGPEPPILDGSFLPYVEALAGAGEADQPGEPTRIEVVEPFTLSESDASYLVAPGRGLRITATVEWDHPLIGRQTGSYEVTTDSFRHELAAARTFEFTEFLTRVLKVTDVGAAFPHTATFHASCHILARIGPA